MHIKSLTQPSQTQPPPGSVMVVSYGKGEAKPTEWIANLEVELLALAKTVTQVTNGEEQKQAVAAQNGLARYVRAVQSAEEKAKAPVNALRKKILDLSKSLTAKVDSEGSRIGQLVAEFQTAEKIRVAAARRARDETASILNRERDDLLSKAKSSAEQDAIRDDYADRLAAESPNIEVVRTEGQRIAEDWDIVVTDVISLFRNHSQCVKMTPLVGEIKALLNEGVIVKGVTAKKIVKAGVVLKPEREAIEI